MKNSLEIKSCVLCSTQQQQKKKKERKLRNDKDWPEQNGTKEKTQAQLKRRNKVTNHTPYHRKLPSYNCKLPCSIPSCCHAFWHAETNKKIYKLFYEKKTKKKKLKNKK